MSPESPSGRWRRLVTARLDEMERLQPGRGDLGPAFWDERAGAFAAAVAGTAERDPFLEHVRRSIWPDAVVADIGAGPGRFTLALAPDVAEVLAVDHSRTMLDLLEEGAAERDLDNITTRGGRWPAVEGVRADVVICSFVIPLIPDIGAFLRALDAAAEDSVHVSMNAVSRDLVDDHLWRFFHGRRRRPAPTYLDAVAVLKQLGLDPAVDVAPRPAGSGSESLDAAVERYRRRLLLDDTRAVHHRLRALLTDWLIEHDGGLHPPLSGGVPTAIISWTTG